MGIPFVRSWKAIALRGLAGVLFGLAAFLVLEPRLPVLVVAFGLYALVDGVFAVLAGAHPGSREMGWLLDGLLGMALGGIALLWVGMTLPALTGIVAFWAISSALLELFAAARMRGEVPGDLSLTFAWVGSLLLGIVLLLWPTASSVVFTGVLGAYALLFGGSMLVLALQLRKLAMRLEPTARPPWRGRRHGHA